MEMEMEKNEPYMQTYLQKNKTKSGYKRVVSSPLRYAGGKSKAVGIILENIPKLKSKRIVSPFFGGGSVELCLCNQLDFEIIGYDTFEILTNFWNIFIHHKKEFIEELKKFSIDKEEFTKNRHILLSYWDKVKPNDLKYNTKKIVELSEEEKCLLDNNKLLQAVYYYYNMSLCYGPMFLGWPSSHEISKDKFDRRLKNLEKYKMKNIQIQCMNFEDSIPLHKDDFLFVDPPYYLGEDSKMFKGMYPNCNFAIHHNTFDHKKLFELLNNHKGGFLITYNNCETIRTLYKDYQQVFPEWQYTYGQGETRIGKNRKEDESESNIKESHEIIIVCPPL